MGWISERHMKTGTSLYSGGPKRKGPLRKVLCVVISATNMFDSDTSGLECGHVTHRSHGGLRAICTKCAKSEPVEFDVKDPSDAHDYVFKKGKYKSGGQP